MGRNLLTVRKYISRIAATSWFDDDGECAGKVHQEQLNLRLFISWAVHINRFDKPSVCTVHV